MSENDHPVDMVIKAGEVGHPLFSTNRLKEMGYATILGCDHAHLYHVESGTSIPIHEENGKLLYVVMHVSVWAPEVDPNMAGGKVSPGHGQYFTRRAE